MKTNAKVKKDNPLSYLEDFKPYKSYKSKEELLRQLIGKDTKSSPIEDLDLPYPPAPYDEPEVPREFKYKFHPIQLETTQPKIIESETSMQAIKHVPRLLIANFDVKPIFSMGVEFEGMVSNDSYSAFKTGLIGLGKDDEGNSLIQFGTDASIRNIPAGYQGVEIRTKVVRSRTGIRLFEEILCFLYLASQTGDFITNNSCGLHINISEKNVFDSDKQVDYYCEVLKHFDEQGVLRRFDRMNNKYCLPFFKSGEVRNIRDILHNYNLCKRREKAAHDRNDTDPRKIKESKYFAVSLRDSPQHDGYKGGKRVNERIEFRCLGNADYHLRFDDLEECVNHIISVVRLAYREVTNS